MKPYVIKQGDHLLKLAHLMGFDADKVWNDGANAELKDARQDPTMLQAGDILMVPDEPKKQLDLKHEEKNEYVAKVPKVAVSVAVADDEEPLAGEAYVVEGLGDEEERTTDADGMVTFEAPVNIREVTVRFVNVDLAFRVGVGELDPVDTDAGVRMRLTQLGFYGPTLAGEDQYVERDDSQLAAAIAAFQGSKGLAVTGEMDDATKDALLDAHGS
jgi:N-acetylmuramoyl-L-alanine amidase